MWVVLCICFCLIMLLTGGGFWFRKNVPKGLLLEEISQKNLMQEGDKRTLWFEFWYPFAFGIYARLQRQKWIKSNEEKINQLQKIYVNQGKESLREFYFCYRFIVTVWLVIGISVLVIAGILSENGDAIFYGRYWLAREEPGGGERQVTLEAEAAGEVNEVKIIISERKYTKEEIQWKMQEAKEYILENYLGDNPSENEVSRPLQLVSRIPDSKIQIEWKLDANGYINQDGTLNQDEITQKREVTILAKLSYGERKEKLSFTLEILPRKKSQKELFWEKWNMQLEMRQKESEQKNVLSLPEEVDGIPLSYIEKKSSPWLGFWGLGMLGCFLIPWLLDYEMEKKINKREEELRKEYPELVERFILLMGAGLSIRGVWYRIAKDYEKRCLEGSRERHYLYEEMLQTCRAMDNGQSEAAAYSDFGRRLSLMQYMRFQTLLIQNLKKGSKDLLQRMDQEAQNALQERRELARKAGEEAGTKLLIPMMLMLAVVFAMILIAAFQNI